MEASFVDLRKKSAEIIKALNRKERVTLLYRGKPAAIMEPVGERSEADPGKACEHVAFGLWADRDTDSDVGEQVRKLRRRRFNDL